MNLSHWRYAPLLPIRSEIGGKNAQRFPPIQIGWTPLYRAKRLEREWDCSELYVKDDGRNPSASLKDRASSVVLVRAQEEGAKRLTGASTGNAGSSLACLAASLGIPVTIFVPQAAPKAKIAQLLVFGAQLVAVKGTYDDAFDLCLAASKEFGWYNRNTGYNPFTREGKKSCAYEICEQLGWRSPELVFVSVGDGNIISGLWKGFKDLVAIGFIHRLPKMIGVQSEKSNAISLAFQSAIRHRSSVIKIQSVKATTLADSISVNLPRDGVAAVQAVLESKGEIVEVTDQEILTVLTTLPNKTGVFAEPAGVASLAGLKKMLKKGKIKKVEKIVCVVTGNGLKDVDSALKSVEQPIAVEPSITALKKYLNSRRTN